jgi:hypothetical protein
MLDVGCSSLTKSTASALCPPSSSLFRPIQPGVYAGHPPLPLDLLAFPQSVFICVRPWLKLPQKTKITKRTHFGFSSFACEQREFTTFRILPV